MEWWESTEEYNPGTSLWRGRKISDDTSSYGSDLEIIEEKETPKDKSLKVCRRNLFAFLTRRYRTSTLYLYRPCIFLIQKSKQEIKTTVADISDQSVVEISSDDGMEVDSPLKQPTRKRQPISSVSDCILTDETEHRTKRLSQYSSSLIPISPR